MLATEIILIVSLFFTLSWFWGCFLLVYFSNWQQQLQCASSRRKRTSTQWRSLKGCTVSLLMTPPCTLSSHANEESSCGERAHAPFCLFSLFPPFLSHALRALALSLAASGCSYESCALTLGCPNFPFNRFSRRPAFSTQTNKACK